MKTVLVVEDNNQVFEMINNYFDGIINVLRAEDLDSGYKLFDENSNVIDLIIMDACVPGIEPNSMPLIKKIINLGFTKPIIANSSNSDFNDILIEAGATHKSEKYKAGILALELLGEQF